MRRIQPQASAQCPVESRSRDAVRSSLGGLGSSGSGLRAPRPRGRRPPRGLRPCAGITWMPAPRSVRASSARGQSRLRRPSPTGTTAPTSERTIEWQNASARTVAASTPSSSRLHEKSSRVRTVVAPSRCLGNAAKSRSPTSDRAASSIASASRALAPPDGVVTTQRVALGGRVGDPVDVASLQGREACVETRGGPARARRTTTSDGEDAAAADSRASGPGARSDRPGRSAHAVGSRSTCTTWPRACTPASVRPATVRRTGSGLRSTGGEGRRQLALDRAQPRLGGPAGEAGAVVGEVEPHPQAALAPAPPEPLASLMATEPNRVAVPRTNGPSTTTDLHTSCVWSVGQQGPCSRKGEPP